MIESDRTERKLTALECAARTGLTVRALRVYERYDLLKPARTRSGWRQYGTRELARLNTICVLKTAGLTLAEIRAVVRRNDPSLQRMLQSQVEGWKRKKEDAEQGRVIAEAALHHLQSDQGISIDQLCELIRSHQTGSKNPALGEFMQGVLALPRQERRAWAERHNEQINPQAMRDFQQEVTTRIDPALEQLMDAGMPPTAPDVQHIIALHLHLTLKYGIRQATTEWLTGTAPKNDRFSADVAAGLRDKLSQRVLPLLKRRPTDSSEVISSQWTSNPFLVGYFAEAELHSAACRALDRFVLKARHALHADFQNSNMAQQLTEEFCSICSEHALGDALTYARWAALVRPPPLGMTESEDRTVWNFLADATSAANDVVG